MGELAAVISAVAGGIGVVVALVGLLWQARQSRLALGVDLVLRLEEQFNSPEFHAARRTAAASLRREPDDHLDTVIDFFETVGLLTRKRVLNAEVIWHELSYWIFGYWFYAQEYVMARRSHDPVRWTEFEWLYERMLGLEYTMRRRLKRRLAIGWLDRMRATESELRDLAADLQRITLDLVAEERRLIVDESHRAGEAGESGLIRPF